MAMSDWERLAQSILQFGQRAEAAALREMDRVMEEVEAEAVDLCPVSPTNAFIDGTTGGRVNKAGERDAKRRLRNPHYTGHPGQLRDTRDVKAAERRGDVLASRIAFTAKHAAAVHEVTDARHGAAFLAAYPYLRNINPRGQAKFLAIPMLRRRRSAVARIAAAVQGVTGV